MLIFISKRGTKDSWTSFETDPYLRLTKKRIYERCVPCLSDLLQKLKVSPEKVVLSYALNCWKLCVILQSYEDCLHFLMLFSELWPEEYVYGKFGTGNSNKITRVVVFHLDDNFDRLRDLQFKVQKCAGKLGLPFEIKVSRGCSFPFEFLFGPSESWKKEMQVMDEGKREWVINKLREMLYGGHADHSPSHG